MFDHLGQIREENLQYHDYGSHWLRIRRDELWPIGHCVALVYIVININLAWFNQIISRGSFTLCIKIGLVALDFMHAPVLHSDAILMAHLYL